MLVYKSKLGKHLGKLRLRYVGPFRIAKDLGQGTFQLMDMQGRKVVKPINGFRLKKFFEENDAVPLNLCLVTSVKAANLNNERGILKVGDVRGNLIIEVTCDSNCFTCVRSLINFLHEYLTVKWRSHTCVWQKGNLKIAALRFSISTMRTIMSMPASGKEIGRAHV